MYWECWWAARTAAWWAQKLGRETAEQWAGRWDLQRAESLVAQMAGCSAETTAALLESMKVEWLAVQKAQTRAAHWVGC